MAEGIQQPSAGTCNEIDEESIVTQISTVQELLSKLKSSDLKDVKYATLASKYVTLKSQYFYQVLKFREQLRESYGNPLVTLQNTCLEQDINYFHLLQEIASEHHFTVSYLNIEEKNVTEKWQCLVQLTTLPVAVCYGSGANPQEAQSSAARNALEYLKILIKHT